MSFATLCRGQKRRLRGREGSRGVLHGKVGCQWLTIRGAHRALGNHSFPRSSIPISTCCCCSSPAHPLSWVCRPLLYFQSPLTFFLVKHFLNDPSSLVVQSLQGLCAINPKLGLDVNNKVVFLADQDRSRVGLICGGGSGHEPSHAGFVGQIIGTILLFGLTPPRPGHVIG
jgi:Dak1 domain